MIGRSPDRLVLRRHDRRRQRRTASASTTRSSTATAWSGRSPPSTGGSAKVTLIADGSSAVSAKVVPLGVQGVIRPVVGDPGGLILDFIDSTKHVHKGQEVVTAGWRAQGLESALPAQHPDRRSRPRPRSTSRRRSSRCEVRPFADLRDLELVQVLTGGSRGDPDPEDPRPPGRDRACSGSCCSSPSSPGSRSSTSAPTCCRRWSSRWACSAAP